MYNTDNKLNLCYICTLCIKKNTDMPLSSDSNVWRPLETFTRESAISILYSETSHLERVLEIE